MEYISDESYAYIMAKNKEWFHRNDELFVNCHDDETLSPSEIYTGIRAQDDAHRAESHPVRKALAFEYVLTHTGICCDKRDPFPAFQWKNTATMWILWMPLR